MASQGLKALENNLKNPLWRMNNLYRIIDEDGKEVDFRMRPAQVKFAQNLWYRNIVLKARQLGFTTLIDLMALDMTIFNRNFTSVIIAETKEKAADIFQAKVMYPYERLPKEIKAWCPVVAHSAEGEVAFGNGGRIKVMCSARSGTCQFLHVSEYGPVCARFPARAQEIKTGSFPAVHAGNYVFVESTAMGNSGDFYDMVQNAKRNALSGAKLNALDYRLHFFPWWENQSYRIPAVHVLPERILRYFDELYSAHQIEVDEEQMAWYAAQEAELHEAIWAEYPSYPDEAFKVAQDGAYYGRWFNDIYRTNRICNVPYTPELPVYTAWDLGMSDETSVWFFQFYDDEVRVIDYYQNSGEGLPHYFSVLADKGYRYGGHFAPHDIAVRELGSGVSRMETAEKYGVKFTRIPTNLDVGGGIENVREMLAFCHFDESKTAEGRKCLEAYKRDWDDKHGCFKSQPCHDWASHGADAFRTGAVAWRMGLCNPAGQPKRKFKVTGGLRKL